MFAFCSFLERKKRQTSVYKNQSVKTPIKKNMESDFAMFNKNKWENYICNNSPQLVLNFFPQPNKRQNKK